MTLPLVLRPEAQNDLLAARDWYERQRPGLGDRFTDAAEEMLSRIRSMPEIYAEVLAGVRRAKLRKFPYVVYYRLLTDRTEVIGVLYGGRNPRIWQERI